MKKLNIILALAFAFVYVNNLAARGLEEKFPGFSTNVPRLDLIPAQTPLRVWNELEQYLQSLGAHQLKNSLWIKHDDLSGQRLGGNKARKLEYILGQAIQNKDDTVVTFGAWGSNHAYATTMAARQLGLDVELHLGPQPVTENVRKKLLADFAMGAKLVYHKTRLGLGLAIARTVIRSKLDPHVNYVPPGGSNPVGTLGYVDGMLELVAQFKQLQQPLPEEIYLPMGTAGTAAGLMVGACVAGVLDQMNIVAVGISHDLLSNERLVRRLARKTHQYLLHQLTRKQRRSFPDCDYNKSKALKYVNKTAPRYGEAPLQTQAAIQMAREQLHLVLDSTYSGKAFAFLLEQLKEDLQQQRPWKRRLFWMTYNSYSLDEIIQSYPWKNPAEPWRELPKDFHALFQDQTALSDH